MAEMRVQLLRPEASVPRYATLGAAGLDLTAALSEPETIEPNGGRAMIPTAIAIELPFGHEGQVRPRSGLAARHGVTVLNSPGTIDEDYRGELKIMLINHGTEPFEVHPGDRIAQLVVAPVARVAVDVVEALSTTDRGEGGFGSTGVAG